MAYYTFGLLVLSTFLPSVHSRPPQDSHPIASCPSSDAVRFRGTTANNVESFLNIRFGEDTSGSNRFTPPKPFYYTPGQDEYLRVIGGPDSWSRNISNGQHGYDGLAARCAFWTSQEVLDGMGV